MLGKKKSDNSSVFKGLRPPRFVSFSQNTVKCSLIVSHIKRPRSNLAVFVDRDQGLSSWTGISRDMNSSRDKYSDLHRACGAPRECIQTRSSTRRSRNAAAPAFVQKCFKFGPC